ncbi:MAG TPA: hypothetical protein VF691_01865 [Cytophagaceae bacterium]|jgi:Flp pilus assembly protein TadD/outer membrane protein OmpA-like peptidoglycan-associated protein
MNLLKQLSLTAATGSMLVLGGCTLQQMVKMSKEQKLTVSPSPLELHGDSVRFNLSAQLPAKMLKKNKIYTATTFYRYGDQTMNLGEIQFKSVNFPNAKTIGPTLSKNFSFGYKPDITNGDVTVVGTATNIKMSKKKATLPLPVAKGIITTSRLTKEVFYISYAEHGYNNREELIPNKVDFFFEQGSSKLRVRETGGKQGKYVDAFINKKNPTRTVRIIGNHSPEGAESINAKLSDERAKAIEKYYKGRMKKYKLTKQADTIEFAPKGIVQDWEGLKNLMDSTNYVSADQKAEILDVINGAGTFEEKEQRLHKLGSYKIIFTKLYPQLRTAKTEILTIKPKKTDEQIATLAKGISSGTVNQDTLNDQELSYAATLTASLDEKESIYTAATKKNDSWASHNNLGAVYLERASKETDKANKDKYLTQALTQFEISAKGQNNAEAHNNMGIIYLLRGDRTQGLQHLQQASQLPTNDALKKGMNGTRGILLIKEGRYEEAVQSLTSANQTPEVTYNLALANLLKKDFSAAKSGFESVISSSPSDAWAFYGSAITAAKLKDASTMNSRLKSAVQLDRKLADKAKADLEFLEYFETPEFKSSVQ